MISPFAKKPEAKKNERIYVWTSECILGGEQRGNPPQNTSMSQRKRRRGETRGGSRIPPKPLFHPRPRWDPRAWRDPGAPAHSPSEFPFLNHNVIHRNHQPARLLLKRNPGICCNYAFLTILILKAGNSFCYHCFSNMHLKCSIVSTGWCDCLSGIFSVPWAQHNGVHASFNNLTLFFSNAT